MPLEPITGQVQYKTDTGPVEDLVSMLRELSKATEAVADKFDKSSEAGERDEKTKGEQAKRTLDVNEALKETSRILGGLTSLYSDALSKATEFGSAMGQVATLSTEVSGNLDAYNDQVLQLSASMGVDAKQAADTFYQAISSGAASDAAGGLRIVETALKASVGGATDAATAVDGITTAMNAWKESNVTASQASDILFKSVALGKTTMGEMSSALFQAGPLAASVGVSMEEVAAATATLTKSGTPTSAAMTQIRASMVALVNPNAELQAILESLAKKFPEMGEASGQAALDTFGYHESLQMIVAEAESMGVSLPKALGSVEAMGAALGVSGSNAATAMSDLEGMNNAAGETDKAYETMANTFGFASNQLRETANAALIEIGTTLGQMLVPAIQAVTGILSGLMERWNEMDDGTKRAIVTIGGIVALIGSGIGVFLTLSTIVSTIGPVFSAAAGGVTLFSGALAATGIGVAVLAVGALVKGAYDAKSAFGEAYDGVKQADGGLKEYVATTQQTIDKSTGLAKAWNVLSGEAVRNDLAVKKAGEAYLQHGLGVDKAVISSRAFQQESSKLALQHDQGKLSLDQYNAALVELANAESMAAGEGRVLSEVQQEQAAALTLSTQKSLEKLGTTGEAIAADVEFQRVSSELAATVAQGQMTQDQYNQVIGQYIDTRRRAVEAEQEAAAATAVATGAMHEYSSSFAALTGAGSQFIADEQERAKALEEAWGGLGQGVQSNLQEQWDARQKFYDDLAAARAADAQAAADAQTKRAEAEAAHGEKMVELNSRMEDAKTDKQRASAEKAIAKENEKLAGILSATESVGGANVERVKAQYAEQVAAQQEALAQMIVDHVTSMVLMGQTSEETAKTIFATLRKAYPDVEVFSPVADAHVELMGTIRDATDESSASQMESIARLPDALSGAVDGMEENYGRAKAEMDTWATAADQLAGTHEAATGRMISADGDLVAAGEAATVALAGQDATAVTSAQGRHASIGEALTGEQTSHTETADAVEAQNQRIRDSSETTATSIANDSKTIEGAGSTISGGFSMAASEIGRAAGTIVSSTGTISSATADVFTKAGESQRAALPLIEEMAARYDAVSGTIDKAKGVTEEAGAAQVSSHKRAGDAASESGGVTRDAMEDSATSMLEAQTSAEDLASALEDLPTKLDIPITLVGAGEAMNQVTSLLTDLARLPRTIRITVKADYNPTGPAMEDDASIRLQHYLEDAIAAAEPGVQMAATYEGAGLMEQDGSDEQLKLQTALENLQAVLAEGQDWDASWQAVWDTFFQAPATEEGSLAWWLQELRTGRGIDLQNLPVPKMNKVFSEEELSDWRRLMDELPELQERIAAFQQMSLEDQRREWPRLYEDLKRFEDERHKLQMENMKRLQERMGSHSGTIGAMIDAERRRHDLFMDGLEDENRAVKRQGEDYKEWEKARQDALREYERAQKELERALEQAHRERMAQIKEEQKEVSEYAKIAHDEVLDLLEEEKDTNDRIHQLRLQAIDELADAEKRRHDAEMRAITDEQDAIKDYIDSRERALRNMQLDFEEWMQGRQAEADMLKLTLEQVNDAVRDLPTGRKQKAKPEDMIRVTGTTGQLDVIQKALAEGVFAGDERMQRLAETFVGSGSLRLDYLRDLLTMAQKYYQGEEKAFDAETDRRKQEIEDAELRWKREKDGLDLVLSGLDERRRIEDEAHKARMAEINAEKAAEDERFKTENERLDALKKLEEERHKARLKAIEEEYALRLMIEEGLSPEEAARRIAAQRENVARAMAEAARLLAELEAARAAVAGQAPIVARPGLPDPGAPGIPTPPPFPPPGGGTTEGDMGAFADAMGAATGGLMSLADWLGMIPTAPAATEVSPLIQVGGQTSYTTTFYGPVIVSDEDETGDLLRASLGAWGTRGGP